MPVIYFERGGLGEAAPLKFSQDEWVIRNGFVGYKILDAAKNDSLAQFFYESMKAAPYVTTADPRVSIAYGYFVGAGYITAQEAATVCGFDVEPLTAQQVQEKMVQLSE